MPKTKLKIKQTASPSLRPRRSVIVLGAGAGGLASALMLQSNGFDVTLLEKNENIGGKLNSDQIDGYTFDTGPSILTLPTILKELFAYTGADLNDYLELINLDPQWMCHFQDADPFVFRSGEDAMLEEVATRFPADVDGMKKLFRRSRELYKVSEDNFFFRDLEGVMDLILKGNSSSLEALKLMMLIDPLKSYADLVEGYIKNPQLKQALEHLPQYVGSSPFLSPAILGCLIHVQFAKGCWYPMGGMNQISKALVKRFKELGGRIELNCDIQRIYDDAKSIRGLEDEKGYLWTADHYVVNMDVNSFYAKLGKKTAPESRLACSGVTVFLGLKKRVSNMAHHNFFFSASHEQEFKDIYTHGTPHNDPTVYACIPSLTDPSVAPKGKENVFLLIHAPVDNGRYDWDKRLDEYVDLVEAKIAKMGLDVASLGVEVRKNTSPRDIGRRWGTFKGNIYGHASHGKLGGGFKPANRSRMYRNLSFAGGTVNPGAGVPMSIMSGMIAGSGLIQESESLVDIRL